MALIDVDYEVLPAVIRWRSATMPPCCTPTGPRATCSSTSKCARATWTSFAAADVIVERTQSHAHDRSTPSEPECSIAVPAGYDEDHAVDHLRGQPDSYSDRRQAKSLGATRTCAAKGAVMGGGFGGKEIAGQIHRRAGRPG
ncbi:MAG: hypothetical protein R2838_24060 [Caldilineaceae bacterium]